VRRRLLVLLPVLALPGCATLSLLWHLPPRLAACPGPIPSASTLPSGDFVWNDRVRYRGGKVDAGFTLVAEKRADKLVLIGLNTFGARAFSVTQDGDAIETDARLGRALQVPAETVLRDWHALRAATADPPATFELARPECGYTATFAAEGRRPLDAVSASPSP